MNCRPLLIKLGVLAPMTGAGISILKASNPGMNLPGYSGDRFV